MTSGRLKFLKAGEKGPEDARVRARVRRRLEARAHRERDDASAPASGCSRRRRPRPRSPTSAPTRSASARRQLGEILRRESHRLHPLLRDQRALAGIGRAWSNEILHTAKLSPYALSTDLDDEEIERLAAAIDEELARGLALREQGASDERTYRVHNRLGEPCHVCETPIARVDFEEHTIYYCPKCQTGGRVLKDRRLSRLLR